MTEEKPNWMERWQMAGGSAVILVHAHRNLREFFDRGENHVAQEVGTIFARTSRSLNDYRAIGLGSRFMMARICSRLLTLKAGTPYPYSAA